MESQLEIKLIECLSRLDDGEPIERILARYPDDAAGLRPLLETATALADLRSAPRETARIASRRAFLAQAHELRESSSQRRSWLPRRIAIPVAALVVAFIFMSGAVAASASALPSEPLYGVKRAVEDAQLLVAAGPEKEQLAASFGQRRRDEINLLLAMRRDTAIAFEGTIEVIQPNGWEISGLYIYFDQSTTIAGMPVIGSHTHIQGHTEAGRLLADSVSIDPSSESTISPTATATATPSATAKPVATATLSATAIPSRSPTPQPESTSQPEPTPAPTRAPTTAPRLRATSVPPASVPPTAAPPTAESDNSGSGSVDDNGGADDKGGDNSGSGSNDSGGGDNGGSHDGGGDISGGNDTSGGGDDHGGSGDSGGGSDSGGGDHGGSGGGSGGDGGGGHGGGGDDKP